MPVHTISFDYTIIYIIIYFITLLAVALVLFLIAIEWNEWGQEMAILTSETTQSTSLVAQTAEQNASPKQSFSNIQYAIFDYYFEIYASHVNTFDNFLKEIQHWLDTSTNWDLLSYLTNFPYFSRLPEPQTMKLYVFSLVFALMGNLQGKVFSYCPTTLSKSLAEVRFASLVAWA